MYEYIQSASAGKKSDAYLGGQRAGNNAVSPYTCLWGWSDGSPVSFINFAAEVPIPITGTKITMKAQAATAPLGQWSADAGTDDKNWVCEYKKR